MKRSSTFLLLAAIVTTSASAATDGARTVVEDCIDLRTDYALVRGGARQLYVSDGEQRYRLSFERGSCEEMNRTGKLRLETDGITGRMCPGSARLLGRRTSCGISTIEQLEHAEFDRLTRAWRR